MNFVADERSEIPRCAFHLHTKFGAILAAMTGSELFSERTDRPRQVVGNHRGRAQSLYRIPALDDRLPSLVDDFLQRLPGFFRAIRELVSHRGKFQQDPLKTLQQGIVQFSRDSRALAHSLFQAKFQDASRYGPSEECRNENSGDRGCRHDKKDPALDISHIRDGTWKLFIEVPVNALDVGRSRSLDSF